MPQAIRSKKNVAPAEIPIELTDHCKQTWVAVDKMFVDPAYQRVVEMDRVRGMANNFNPDAIGVVYVSKRTTGQFAGMYSIFDGQHRWELMKMMGWTDQKMPALVFEGLSLEQEATLFRVYNQERTRPKPLALFKARVTEGDPDAVSLARVLDNLGLSYDSYANTKGIRAIDTIAKVQAACGLTVVRRALTAMTQAWGHDADSLNGEVFKGVALLLFVYGGNVDVANLANKLKDHGPKQILARARQMKDIMPEWQAASCMASVVVNIYNYRLRENSRLASWEGQTFPRKAMARNPQGVKKAAKAA